MKTTFGQGLIKAVRTLLVPAGLLLCALQAGSHSVGQVQTTKFLAPETVTQIQNRITANQAPFQVGDIVSYIIQFTPVANGATVGAGGYITDYLPPGVEVVGASIVAKGVGDTYYNVAPQLPGGIDTGWGDRGQKKTYLSPFNVATYGNAIPSLAGQCATKGYSDDCNGRLTEIYADTGIFYSTDSRTAVFPALPTRIAQGTNGYKIDPTAAGALNTILGQASYGTTHNLWDADQTNAFGTGAQTDINSITAPKSSAPYLGNGGTGATPFGAGSAVAGPQTGYPLDNTGAVGPWNRIAYLGSRIGTPSTGPATDTGTSITAISGLPTSLGFNLSTSSPLPSNTNAVRWAVGRLQVGTINYVKISMRITSNPPVGGFVNSSEVFGGDAAEDDNGKDNPWRYHMPSVADNNTNLYVKKTLCEYSAEATVCVPKAGNTVTTDTTLTYQITYINTGATDQTNVVLKDVAPCQTPAGRTVRIGAVTGPLALLPPLTSLPYTTTTVGTPNCNSTPDVGVTVTFPTISTLAAGSGGNVIINVPSANAVGNVLTNKAILTSSAVSVSSFAVAVVGDDKTPALALVKTVSPSSQRAGGTVQYVIVAQNTGTGPATGFQVDEFLPTLGGSVDPNTRFNYLGPTTVTSAGLTTNTALVTSTSTAATAPTLPPYGAGPDAANTVRVNYNFGTNSSLAAGGVVTITFVASVGAAVTTGTYYNNLAARGTTNNLVRIDSNVTAPVAVVKLAILAVTKTNGTTTVAAGSTTTYTIVASNTGPDSADGAILTDVFTSSGLQCAGAGVTCPPANLTGGATCPVTPGNVLSVGGAPIPVFPSNSSVTLLVQCSVTASGS